MSPPQGTSYCLMNIQQQFDTSASLDCRLFCDSFMLFLARLTNSSHPCISFPFRPSNLFWYMSYFLRSCRCSGPLDGSQISYFLLDTRSLFTATPLEQRCCWFIGQYLEGKVSKAYARHPMAATVNLAQVTQRVRTHSLPLGQICLAN